MNHFIRSDTEFDILVIKDQVNLPQERASSIKLHNFTAMISSEQKRWHEEKVDVTS